LANIIKISSAKTFGNAQTNLDTLRFCRTLLFCKLLQDSEYGPGICPLLSKHLIAPSQFSAQVSRTSGQDEGDEDPLGVLAAHDVEAEAAAAFDQLHVSRFARKKPVFQPLSESEK
jgi:hypothetical protein